MPIEALITVLTKFHEPSSGIKRLALHNGGPNHQEITRDPLKEPFMEPLNRWELKEPLRGFVKGIRL